MSDNTDLLTTNPGQESDITADTADAGQARARLRGGLAGLKLPQLQEVASALGVTGTARMRKSDLVAAIEARQGGGNGARPAGAGRAAPPAPRSEQQPALPLDDDIAEATDGRPAAGRTRRTASRPAGPPAGEAAGSGTAGELPGSTAVLDAAATDDAAGAGRPAGGPTNVDPSQAGVAREDSRSAGQADAGPTDAGPTGAGTTGSERAPTPAETAPAARESRVERDGRDRGRGAGDRQRDRSGADRERNSGDRNHGDSGGDRAQGDRAQGDRAQGDRAQGDRAQGDRTPADRGQNDRGQSDRGQSDRGQSERGQSDRGQSERGQSDRGQSERGQSDRGQSDRGQSDRGQSDRGQNDRSQGDRQRDRSTGDRAAAADTGPDRDDDGFDSNGRRRRGRFRDRRRGRTAERFAGETPDPVIAEDDVLLPVAGIVDILDNYAFVRTSGYLTGPNDVYVSLAQVRRYGLRRGDAITGAVRQPRDGERRDKYNALVRLDTVNGVDPDQARGRPEFTKLTPLYPQDRMRLETEPHILTTRVIDLVMPLGKGQRALIVSPPKAGKTMVLQAIANAITTNNPECHLMVVLVDERPEEVTDMQRSVKGEVIASTFDRPPTDHTTVAELSIERAKRLVELGHDVVVLLDSITRLGRAYNLAAPASGRILSGGVDSTALYPPKRFLGAARNIENGGSLTILATALVETGSTMDTVIFEEFKGTGNAELRLDRKIADKRVFPAVDVDQSSTRKEEILLAPDELAIVHKLRRVLHALDSQQAIDLLLDKLKETRTNVEFLMQIQKTTPGD